MTDPVADTLELMVKKLNSLHDRVRDLENIAKTPYAVGSWTPVLAGVTTPGTFTYSVQTGRYIKNGGLMGITGHITITAIAVNPVGNMQISGLPLSGATPDLSGTVHLSDWTGFTLTGARTVVGGRIMTGTSVISLIQSGSGLGATFVPGSGVSLIGTVVDLNFSGIYRI